MKFSIRTASSLLVCASVCLVAVPGQAQHSLTKTISKAQEKANAAAAKAKTAAEAQASAEKAAANLRAGIKTPEAKAAGARFTPAVVKPYLDTLNAMLADSKGVTTAAQAPAFLDKFRSALPRLTESHKKVMDGYADFDNSGAKTPDNLNAEKMLTDAGTQAEAIDNELTRIEKIYGAAKPDFQKFRDLYN